MKNYKEYDEQIECPYPVVAVKAIDWAMYDSQYTDTSEFKLIPGMICGWLLEISEEKVVICLELFDGSFRHTVVIPTDNILELEIIRPKGEKK